MSLQQRKRCDISPQVESGGSSETLDDLNKKGPVQPRRRRRIKGEATENDWLLRFGLMMFVVLVASYFLVTHHEKIQIEHVRENILHDKVEPLSREWEEKYAKLEEENVNLKIEAADKATFLDSKEQLEKKLRDGEKLRETQEGDIKHLTEYKQRMKNDIQFMSKTALLEKCVRTYFERLCLLL
jgi:hypothetical protein